MYLFPHTIAERGIDELVLLHLAFVAEERAHDDRLEMPAVACDLDVLAFETLFDVLLDEIRIHGRYTFTDSQCRSLYPERMSDRVSNDKTRKLVVTNVSDNHGETSAWPKNP